MKIGMMKISFFFAVAAAVLLSACSQEDVQNGQSDSRLRHSVTLSASGEEGTRAVFATNVKSDSPFYWQSGDAIGVSTSGAETLSQLDLKSRSANMQLATFTGDIEGELGDYAVYPYNENHKISGTTLTYHLPSEYAYDRWDTDFAPTTDKVDDNKISANPALWAKISAGDNGASAQFKHLGGLLCIKIDQMPATQCFLTVTADRQICGDFTVDLSSSQPKIVSDEENTEVPESLKTVTITANGAYGTSGVFYIPMPVGADYKINVKLGYSDVATKLEMSSCTSAKTVEIERGKIKIATLTQSKMYKNGSKVVYGHKFVDLGLSKLWAETNVGGTVAADYGNYYSWAETFTKRWYLANANYYSDSYDVGEDEWYCKKYQDSNLTLSDEDDAAYVVWGKLCKTPTKSEVQELIDGTTQKEASRKNSNGETISGLEFTSKTNGNSIFIPYNGYYQLSGPKDRGTSGCYWTSTSGETKELVYDAHNLGYGDKYSYRQAYRLIFSQNSIRIEQKYRIIGGQGIRPVLK